MRLILVLLIASIASSASAERIFRASLVDMEQDGRIDVLEAKVTALVKMQSAPVKVKTKTKTYKVGDDIVVSNGQTNTVVRVGEVDGMIAYFTAPKQVSSRYDQSELISIVKDAYPNGDYTRYATVSPANSVWRHLKDNSHQFTAEQINGLPQNIALGLHGLHHANRVRPERVEQPCANGQCAKPSRRR